MSLKSNKKGRNDVKEDIQMGWAVLLCCIGLSLVPSFYSFSELASRRQEVSTLILQASRTRVAKTAAMSETMYFLEKQKEINRLAANYRAWLSDGKRGGIDDILSKAGFSGLTSKTKKKADEGTVSSSKSEFMKVAGAISQCEIVNGLCQFTSVKMRIPKETLPASLSSSYLISELKFSVPTLESTTRPTAPPEPPK